MQRKLLIFIQNTHWLCLFLGINVVLPVAIVGVSHYLNAYVLWFTYGAIIIMNLFNILVFMEKQSSWRYMFLAITMLNIIFVLSLGAVSFLTSTHLIPLFPQVIKQLIIHLNATFLA